MSSEPYAAEADTGVLPLLQYKNDDGSVSSPAHLPAADGITFPSGTEFRIGIALARQSEELLTRQ